MAASGVPLVVGPLSNALLPRLARLHAQGDREELMLLYEKMTQVVAMLVAPLCYLLSSFSWKIMFVWTGDRLVATQGGALMSLYALGNGLLALAAFPYYLQYANGKLKLHLIGSRQDSSNLSNCVIIAHAIAASEIVIENPRSCFTDTNKTSGDQLTCSLFIRGGSISRDLK